VEGNATAARTVPEAELPVLVVEDEADVVRTIARLLPHPFAVRHVSTRDEAIDRLRDDPQLRVALIDVSLHGDATAGLEVLESASALRADLPVAIVTGQFSREIATYAAARGALFVPKPIAPGALGALLARARKRDLAPPESMADALARRAEEWGLSPTQRALVAAYLEGRSRAEIAQELGIAESTVKTHVQRLLAKIPARNLADVASRLGDRAKRRA
jgi:DNA-binding NarL/FixJ family response regulator